MLTDGQAAQVSNRPRYSIRAGTPGDEGFVAKTWVGTVRGSTPSRQLNRQDQSNFARAHYAYVSRLLKRCEVRVACPPSDEATIVGIAVLEPSKIHLVHVIRAWRRYGIARALLHGFSARSTFTVWSNDATQWGLDKFPEMTFSPYWLSPDWMAPELTHAVLTGEYKQNG